MGKLERREGDWFNADFAQRREVLETKINGHGTGEMKEFTNDGVKSSTWFFTIPIDFSGRKETDPYQVSLKEKQFNKLHKLFGEEEDNWQGKIISWTIMAAKGQYKAWIDIDETRTAANRANKTKQTKLK